MEGTLKIYTNFFTGWKPMYFVLHEGILSFCEEKGSELKGRIHLKIANITASRDDQQKIIIDSGTSELNLKAETIADRIRWVSAMKDS